MEILELLFGLVQFLDVCACFLEVVTVGANGTAAYNGVRTYQKRKKLGEQAAHDHGPPLRKPSWWPFVILLIVSIGFTTLLFVKYARPGR